MLLLEPTFSASPATSISLSSHTHSPSGAALDGGLDLSLLASSEDANSKLAVSEAELNDFNIAQLQLQYETSPMDSSLNTMHTLNSIDLLRDHSHHLDPEQDDSDYAARRMSSSAISSVSAQSTQSVHTSSTAATSHSGYSHGQSLKRTQSPSMMDDFDSYDAFDDSPRAKRPRPSLSLEPGVPRMSSSSPAPTNTTASAGANSGDSNGSGSSRVQLPPLYSALESNSNSAPPTSHGTQTPFSAQSGQMQQSYSQAQNQGSPFPTSNFAFNVTGTGLDLRRGSLPSLYSNSLAARSAQRVPGQGQFTPAQNQGRYNFSTGGMGMSPGPSPLSSLSAPGGSASDSSGLAGYQFPPPSSSDSGNGSNGSGSTPTPTPNTSTSAPGASPFGSGMTPTSAMSSAPSSGFPQTPLEFAQQQQQQNSSSYQTSYGQNQNQKEYDRYLASTGGGAGAGAEWGSIARPSSTPSSAANTPASATNPSSGGFGFSSGGGLGGLPRISGHAKNTDHQHQQQQQEWFSSTGQLVLPSPSANTGPGSSQQQHQHPQTASLSPSPRMHSSSSAVSSGSASATAAAAAAAAAALNVSPAAAVQAAQVAAQVAARPARRRGKLPKPTTDFLKDWLHRHSDHPYPSEEEKKQLCHATGLSMSQVSNWMINARRRILAPAQRSQQGPTTNVPSFPLGSAHSSGVGRTPLGLTPAHHGLSSSHLSHSQSSYGMGMNSGLSGMGLGLMGSGLGNGMNGMGGGSMGYQQQSQHHQLLGINSGSGGGMYGQQYRQPQASLGHSALYDIGHLHAQRRASMPTLALHSHSAAHLSPPNLGGSSLSSTQMYATSASARNSLPGPSPLPQVGYTHTQYASLSPQPGQGSPSAPTPQRGYVFPAPAAGGSSSGGEDGR